MDSMNENERSFKAKISSWSSIQQLPAEQNTSFMKALNFHQLFQIAFLELTLAILTYKLKSAPFNQSKYDEHTSESTPSPTRYLRLKMLSNAYRLNTKENSTHLEQRSTRMFYFQIDLKRSHLYPLLRSLVLCDLVSWKHFYLTYTTVHI